MEGKTLVAKKKIKKKILACVTDPVTEHNKHISGKS